MIDLAFKKECPECGEYSYSASEIGMWRCAACGADISEEPAEPAKSEKEN